MGLWIFATFTSYIIKGLCGFANTMVFTAMLSFGSVNANISPVDLLLGYPANAKNNDHNSKHHLDGAGIYIF